MDNEYDIQAETFLAASGTEMTIRKMGVVEGFPFHENDHLLHDRYIVTLKRDDKEYKFPFYNSAMAHERGTKPRPYEILSCIEKYEVPDDMWEFADEYGYEIHCKKDYENVQHIWKECRKQYRALYDLFGPYFMERLAEIS